MPSVNASPAQFAITWGKATALPVRVSADPMSFVLTMGKAVAGPGVNLSPGNNVSVPKLDRIMRQEVITNGNVADERFRIIWEKTMQQIEKAFSNQQGQIDDQAAIVALLQSVVAQLQEVQTQAQTTAQDEALAKSFVTPQNIIFADSSGTILINAHTRVYGDGNSVPVSGGSVSGFNPGDYVQIYYDDAARAGGVVNYQGTTSVVVQSGARHIVGGVAIPPPGTTPTPGTVRPPPGYVPPNQLDSQ